jgi:plastocyanin
MQCLSSPIKLFSYLLIAGLALSSSVALSKSYVVTVGGTTTGTGTCDPYYGCSPGQTTANLMFNPSDIQDAHVGDTVTFTSPGVKNVPHNVHADDNSFRCAAGCDGVQNGNGTASDKAWSSTITLTKAGKLNYHCDIHQAMGMVGSITVADVAPPPPPPATKAIGPSTSGLWYNTDQSGHGFMLEVLPNNVFLGVWFTFTPDGSAQNWLYIQGNYEAGSNTITVAPTAGNARSGVLLNDGAKFPPNFLASDVTTTQWGSMTFTFTDCNHGTVSWNSTLPGYGTGTLEISRLSGLDGLTCQ